MIPYQLMLPLDLEAKIELEESVRTLLEITDKMDYSLLNATYDRQPNESEATPKQMFQLVILGFMENYHTLRKLKKACKNDIRFMYVLRGKPAPSHNRFWHFIKHRLQGEVAEHLFYQLVEYLKEAGELDFANVFIDGTKIEASANRYSFVWKKSTNKYEERLDTRISDMLERLYGEYLMEIPTGTSPEECLEILTELAKARDITFVHGRGKRKTAIQRDIEALEAYLSRKDKYTGYNQTFKGRNSFSKTDPDATFMRMKEDHMMNGQLKPAYNLQLAVEGGYIVGLDISDERSDAQTLMPLLERMEKGTKKRHKNVVTDAGYESEENYQKLEARNQAAYIKPQNYEKSKTRKYKTNAYLRENMPYDPANDTYTCPAGSLFSYVYTTTRKNKSGYESKLSVYECHGCGTCPQKQHCTRAEDNRKLYVSRVFESHRQASRARITSDEGKMLRVNRSIQAEGAFGVLKQDYGFRRFLRRGKDNVFTESIIYAMAFNINKFHSKKIRNLSGVTFHLLDSA